MITARKPKQSQPPVQKISRTRSYIIPVNRGEEQDFKPEGSQPQVQKIRRARGATYRIPVNKRDEQDFKPEGSNALGDTSNNQRNYSLRARPKKVVRPKVYSSRLCSVL